MLQSLGRDGKDADDRSFSTKGICECDGQICKVQIMIFRSTDIVHTVTHQFDASRASVDRHPSLSQRPGFLLSPQRRLYQPSPRTRHNHASLTRLFIGFTTIEQIISPHRPALERNTTTNTSRMNGMQIPNHATTRRLTSVTQSILHRSLCPSSPSASTQTDHRNHTDLRPREATAPRSRSCTNPSGKCTLHHSMHGSRRR